MDRLKDWPWLRNGSHIYTEMPRTLYAASNQGESFSDGRIGCDQLQLLLVVPNIITLSLGKVHEAFTGFYHFILCFYDRK